MSTYDGRVNRVLSPCRLEIDLVVDSLLGVIIRRGVVVDGIPESDIEQYPREIMHCLVILCGGKQVRVSLIDPDLFHTFRADIDVLEHSPSNPPFDGPVNVAKYLSWVASIGYDARALRQALKG